MGRLSHEKGPDVFIEALGLVGGEAPCAAIVGEGPASAALRVRAAALGIDERVRWCGRVDGAAALLPAFDVLVLSSWMEGTPIVLLEAVAAGVPVIATRVGGVAEVVSEAEAVLVEPDNPVALARALRGPLADPVSSAARAVASRERLARESAGGPWLTRYEDLYRGVIRAQARASVRASHAW